MEELRPSGHRSDTPELSVVIPTVDNHRVLARVLAGYERQTAAADRFELIVVADRAEPDLPGLRAVIGARPYAARLLQGTTPGPSGNRNVGWAGARAPIVLFTDDDTVPTPRLVAEHLDWHRRYPSETAVVVGLVRWAPGIRVTPFMRWLERGIQFDFQSITGIEASWAHTYSSNCSVTLAMLKQVGGFDEQRLPFGYEDLDWGYRADAHGLRVLFNREAVVDHWREMTVEQWQARAPRLAASEWQFCAMHPEIPPWFHRLFASAAAAPPARGRAVHLIRWIPRTTPWLGPRVWDRADIRWRQQIAPAFLAEWERVSQGVAFERSPAASAAAERPLAASAAAGRSGTPGGPSPAGPK